MAGTVTVVEEHAASVKKITFTWLSDASGDADGPTTIVLTGKIIRYVEIPDTGGTAPTTAYDVTIDDADGADVLHGAGANITVPGVKNVSESDGLGSIKDSLLTLTVANAGNAKGGKSILYIR
ncbi:MAG: hypothetical protein RX318_03965 [bacterium]|nr:hypothetical protein [bacterium]